MHDPTTEVPSVAESARSPFDDGTASIVQSHQRVLMPFFPREFLESVQDVLRSTALPNIFDYARSSEISAPGAGDPNQATAITGCVDTFGPDLRDNV